MTQEQVIDKLRRMAQARGDQRTLAAELGISEPYLSDIINRRREPGPRVLEAIGLMRIVRYEKAGRDE